MDSALATQLDSLSALQSAALEPDWVRPSEMPSVPQSGRLSAQELAAMWALGLEQSSEHWSALRLESTSD